LLLCTYKKLFIVTESILVVKFLFFVYPMRLLIILLHPRAYINIYDSLLSNVNTRHNIIFKSLHVINFYVK
jgi:hypothetical protein